MTNHKGPPTLCGTTLSFPSLLLRQGEKKDSLLGGHPGKAIPQTDQFAPEVTSLSCSLLLYLAQVAQKRDHRLNTRLETHELFNGSGR